MNTSIEDKPMTYTEVLRFLLDKIEDVEDYVKSIDKKVDSVDDRERILQKDLSRLNGLVEGFHGLITGFNKEMGNKVDKADCAKVVGILTGRRQVKDESTAGKRWSIKTVGGWIVGIAGLILAIVGILT